MHSENAQLWRELDLLRSVVIRMDRQLSHMDDDITNFRSRSMKDNILIHNYPYTQQEDLATTMPNLWVIVRSHPQKRGPPTVQQQTGHNNR